MFLVSQDHDQGPKLSSTILDKPFQTEMFESKQKVGQPVKDPPPSISRFIDRKK